MTNTSNRPLAGKRVLIVEDEPLLAIDLATLFQAAGAAAHCARNMDDAVRVVLANGTDIGVLDSALWGDNTSDHIASLLQMKRIPFVTFSAKAIGPSGAVAAIVKPAPSREVVKACAKYWRRRNRLV